MRRLASLVLAVGLALVLPGCSLPKESVKDTVTFYYQREEFLYGEEDGVIAAESREASGHTEDLSYLLSLYLAGPIDEGLTSPFPQGTKLLSVRKVQDILQVEISDTAGNLSESRFSLACACLSLTSLELTQVTEVTVISGDRTKTMTRDSLLLFDGAAAETTTEETK